MSDATPRARRIAIICDAVAPWHKGGRERLWSELAPRLIAPDQEIHVYTMRWWDGPRDIIRDGVHYHALCRLHPLYRNGRRSTAQAFLFALAVFRLMFEKIDALHADQMPFFPIYTARLVAWLKGLRLTATWHEVWGREYWIDYMGGLAGFVGHLVEQGAIRLPDAIAANSVHTAKRLKAAGARRVEEHPLGVDVAAIARAPRAEIESNVIYVGRLLDHKGVDTLVRAVALLKQERADIRALIVGAGPERALIESLVRDLGLTGNVVLAGEVADDAHVYGLMKASKVLALPSKREGFGLVVLEANAANIPVVTLDHEDNAACDLIAPGVNGLLCKSDPQDLAARLDEALRSRMDPDRDVWRYGWDACASRLDALLRG